MLYRLTARAFHGGRLRERGAIVNLRDDERPGDHMVPVEEAAPVGEAAPAVMPRPVPVPKSSAAPEPAAPEPPLDLSPLRGLAAHVMTPPDDDLSDFLDMPEPGFVVVDTETNGLKEPRLASLALIFVDAKLRIEYAYGRLVRPDGWEMGAEAQAVNGLSMDRLQAEGVPLGEALTAWEMAIGWGRTVVAHNAAFDLRVLRDEMARIGRTGKPRRALCTMLAAREACGRGKLSEAHQALVGRPLAHAHDALADAHGALNVLRALTRAGRTIPEVRGDA